MMDIPDDLHRLLVLLRLWESCAKEETPAMRSLYRLLSSKLNRLGMRWEYFI